MHTRDDYLTRLPQPGWRPPEGKVLVHNQVYPVARRSGCRGSRWWVQDPGERMERCPCGWAPELGEHYRIRWLDRPPA
jgi:hypothetical protein